MNRSDALIVAGLALFALAGALAWLPLGVGVLGVELTLLGFGLSAKGSKR